MARRERTTGLPRHQRQDRSANERKFLGVPVNDRSIRYAIFGSVAVVAVIVLGIFLWRYYQENYVRPDKVVLTVGESEVTLEYYTDRFYKFALDNQTTGSLTGQALLRQIEEEEVTVQLAESKGIDLSNEAVEAFVAEELGVEAGTDDFRSAVGSARGALGWSAETYFREARARAALDALTDDALEGIGETGEVIDFRVVVVASEAEAQDVYDRVTAGEDIGQIAQVESLDLTSRQNDGLVENQPPGVLNDELQAVLVDAEEGDLLEPIESDGSWWVIQVEDIDPEGELTETDRNDLATIQVSDEIEAFRSTVVITSDLTADDVEWATENTTTIETGAQ